MGKVNSLLSQRLKLASEKFSKMTNLAEMSTSGQLSSFSGVFRVSSLSVNEEENLRSLLKTFSDEDKETEEDFRQLSSLTSEVKAINNQAAILHGERIKKAQEILKNYKEGAFTAWLIATYNNRQTPYNFLHYYELYISLPNLLHPKLDEMPRQAVYTLASRSGSLEKKKEIISSYQGAPKHELLTLIRQTFPLASDDKRGQDLAEYALNTLRQVYFKIRENRDFVPHPKQKIQILHFLKSIQSITDKSEIDG